MELLPLSGGHRSESAKVRRHHAHHTEKAPQEASDKWLPSSPQARLQPESSPRVGPEPPTEEPEARLRADHPAEKKASAPPPPTFLAMEDHLPLGLTPSPRPAATPAGDPNPVVIQDDDYLTRPLTVEDLQAGRVNGKTVTSHAPVTLADLEAELDVALAASGTNKVATAATKPTAAPAAKPTEAKKAADVPQRILPEAPDPGMLSRVTAGTMRALHHIGNSFMSILGKGDDTLDIAPTLDKVNALEPAMKKLTDAQLQGLTGQFKTRLAAGETADDILPEAFAAVREASRRVMGMRPYDVQILGGIAMHEGKIAQMNTGEGKTLTATLPVYLNALSGKGVHVVTVNETLARRDAAWMGKLYNFMGLSVGTVVEGMNADEKRKAYNADITYTTNVTLGFDYLRDNMARSKEDVVQRDPNFALVDEVDEILIDEARTPLIISELNQPSAKDYEQMAKVVESLQPGDDFKVNMKERQTWLTDEGLTKAEKALGVDNLYDEANLDKVHYLRAALIARNLFVKDKDYVVHDGKVDIVDEFTGRIMDGRRYNDGIHQALEAKEGVPVQPEQRTMASITYPNLFRRYHKLAGMSGTAKTEEGEFINLYGLGVSVMPPNKPSARADKPDLVYKTYQEKFKAIADAVQRDYQDGKPVLIGTRNIVINEYLHQLLSERGIPHQLLNAKSVKDNTDAENAILAQAGKAGMVTLATNMAGRGVDIKPDLINFKKLTGEAVRHLQQGEKVVVTVPRAEDVNDVRLWMGANNIPVAEAVPNLSHLAGPQAPALFAAGAGDAPQVQVVVDDREANDRKLALPSFGTGVAALNGMTDEFATGGLHIIGTERHESRRIDNQLKGRAGRQGQPGETQFYVSLDDELMRLFGGDRLKKVFDRLGIQNNQAVQDSMLDKAIESAQKKVESMHFDIRKNTTKYDQVLNTQRELIYKDRKAMLDGYDLSDSVDGWLKEGLDKLEQDQDLDHRHVPQERAKAAWDSLVQNYGLTSAKAPASLAAKSVDPKAFRKECEDLIHARIEEQKRAMGPEGYQQFLRDNMMDAMDEGWFEHLESMQEMQSGIGLVAYGEQDPWIAYQKRAFELWTDMRNGIEQQVLNHLLAAPPQPTLASATSTDLLRALAAALPPAPKSAPPARG